MVDPFVGEIRIMGFNFPPRGWAQCNGQLLPISQNTALFSLLGTMYGGDGKSTFALPDLEGRAPMQWGQGPGLSDYIQGGDGGTESVTLLESEMSSHNHALLGSTLDGRSGDPTDSSPATASGATPYSASTPDTAMHPAALSPSGGSLPHSNMQPYLTLNFCVALQGIFPPRT
jgi:microcystin-dependent protein